MKNILFFLLILLNQAFSQFEPNNHLSRNSAEIQIYYNAVVHLNSSDSILNGMVVVKGTEIIYAGKYDPSFLKRGQGVNLYNAHVYAGWVSIADFDAPAQKHSSKTPHYQNPNAFELFNDAINWKQKPSQINLKEVQKKISELAGYGALNNLYYIKNGIFSGYAHWLAYDAQNQLKWDAKAYPVFSFEKGNSVEEYPTSLVGSIALMRQTLYDLHYIKKSNDSICTEVVDYWRSSTNAPVFYAKDHLDLDRIVGIGKEFEMRFNVVLKDDVSQVPSYTSAVKNINLFLSMHPKDPFQFKNINEERSVTLGQLWDWKLGQDYILECYAKNVELALIPDENVFSDLRYWFNKGVSKSYLLASLTQHPAKYLKVSNSYGTLEEGKKASFFITNKSVFEEGAKMLATVNCGKVEYKEAILPQLNLGQYDFLMEKEKWEMNLSMIKEDYISTLHKGKDTIKLLWEPIEGGFQFKQIGGANHYSEFYFGQGKSEGNGNLVEGTSLAASGVVKHWFILKRKEKSQTAIKVPKKEQNELVLRPTFPAKRFGSESHWKDRNYTVLIKNVTVWTNTDKGNLAYHDVLLRNGKIERIAKGIGASSGSDTTLIIDGTGMHLTPGIIDEHSHIALSRGANEAGYNSSAQVRMKDAIDPYDVNIYRQLAGGVTTSQLLHGSANPIGGQSAVIKLRWGKKANDLIMESSFPFIKFALGENVKQSNWGDHQTVRFPQTRMGVEQFYFDEFQKAKFYGDAIKKDSSLRRDLRLDALYEILNKKRAITCHSYKQNEVLMLMRVGDSLGFKVNTFTHILEGYKVADQLLKHGAGASTFSDWWAYKYEVNDAIPYNAQIMHDQGLVVAINSDDAEMGRRLNQEAAKVVLYGGVPEKEALKMVTLNPAKLLHIDDKVGKVKVGYDADVVLWSGHPLSVGTLVNYTFIDGTPYYDRARDLKMSVRDKKTKELLLKEMNNTLKEGRKGKAFNEVKKVHYHCDSLEN